MIVFLFSLAVSAVVVFVLQHRLSFWKRQGIATPETPEFLWGNIRRLIFLQEAPRDCLGRLYSLSEGHAVVGFYIAHRPALMIRDPDVILRVLVSEFGNFSDRYSSTSKFADPLGHSNLFLSKNPRWRVLRSKLSPAFTSGRLRLMHPLVEECSRQLAGAVRGTLDSKELCARYAIDCITTCAFGVVSNSINDPKSEFREFGRKIFIFNAWRAFEILCIFYLTWFVDIWRCSFFHKETTVFMREAFWNVIREREKTKTVRNDLIDVLIQLKNEENIESLEETGETLDENREKSKLFDFQGDDLVAQAAVFFSAGFETTATTISFALYELALNENIQEKLRNDVISAVENNGGKITYDLLGNVPYLDMVIKETLRKYPPFSQLDRKAVRDCYLAPGVFVPNGTPIFVPVMSIHKDSRYFPDPEKFDPERFVENKRPVGYFPFGDGPHNCIGGRFALMVLRSALLNIFNSGVLVKLAENSPKPPLQFNKYSILTGIQGPLDICFQQIHS